MSNYDAQVDELRAHLRRTYDVQGETPSQVVVVRRTDRVLVDFVAVGARRWVVLRSRICDESELNPVAVLVRNGQLAVSSLALMDGKYWVRSAIPLDLVDASSLDEMIATILDAAVELGPARFAAANALSVFASYAD